MRLFPILTAFAATAVAADDNEARCNVINSYIVEAVNSFCSKTNMVAPSDYSRGGKHSTFRYAWIGINGNCDPPQWVPSSICKSQFFNMCVTGDKLGNNYRTYGTNGCQVWEVTGATSQRGDTIPTPSEISVASGWKTILKGLGIGTRDVDEWDEREEGGSSNFEGEA